MLARSPRGRHGERPYHRSMHVRTFDAPRAFREAAGPLLLTDRARNNLPLGILGTLISHPQVYPTFDLWLAERDGEAVGVAVRTHPYKIILAEPAEPEAIDALCDAVLAHQPNMPGVVANLPWAGRFVDRWCARTSARAELMLAQGVYALTRVRDPRPTPGAHRPCRAADRGLLRGWIEDFQTEALAHQRHDPERTDRMLDVRLSEDDADGLWFWEHDGEPVSLAGFGGAGEGGVRIGPVYTPREHRGRGYASNLVADLSRWVLAVRGNAACYLYTDLSNPTSNGIYVTLGYEQIAESAEYEFVR